MSATWDMYTSGSLAGQVKRPVSYTKTKQDTTRVTLRLALVTQLGKYLLRTNDGLDHELILAPGTSDAEIEAEVRDVVLDHPGVTTVLTVNVERVADKGVPGVGVSIAVEYEGIDGKISNIELALGS